MITRVAVRLGCLLIVATAVFESCYGYRYATPGDASGLDYTLWASGAAVVALLPAVLAQTAFRVAVSWSLFGLMGLGWLITGLAPLAATGPAALIVWLGIVGERARVGLCVRS